MSGGRERGCTRRDNREGNLNISKCVLGLDGVCGYVLQKSDVKLQKSGHSINKV